MCEEEKLPITFMKRKYLTKECIEEILKLDKQGADSTEIVEQIFKPESLPRLVRHIVEDEEK